MIHLKLKGILLIVFLENALSHLLTSLTEIKNGKNL